MKSIIALLIAFCFISNSASSQVLFSDNFVYTGTNGDSLTNPSIGGSVWKAHSGGGNLIRNIKFQTAGLSFSGYKGSGLGGGVKFQNIVGTQDVNANIGSNVNAGSIYASFLLRIDSSGGRDTATDYFFHLCDSSGTAGLSNLRARVFVADGSSANTFKIGLSKGTSAKLSAAQITGGAKAPVFTTTEYNVGQTYLVVLQYTFNTTSNRDDNIDLFVIDGTIPATLPTPIISVTDTAISDLKQIQSVVIRQGNVGRTLGILDGIYSYSSWSDIISTGASYIITSTAGSNGSINPSGAVSVASGTNQTFSITPNSGYAIQDVLVDGSSQGSITSYTFNNVTTTHTIIASFQAIVAQPTLVDEDFTYTGIDGDSLTSPTIGGSLWKAHSGGGLARNIQFQNASLSYVGYKGSGLGGSVTFQNTVRSQDVNAYIGNNNKTGSYYTSFLMKIDSSGGKDTATDYFYHLCDTSGVNGVANFRGRVFVADGSTANTFRIGLSKGTGAKLTAGQITAGAKVPVFTTTEYNIGQTYLVVMKYTFNATTTKDDNLDLFVMNTAIPTTEPAATLSFNDTAISDLRQLQSVVIREGSTGRTAGTLDGIKFYSNWSSIIASGTTYTITSSAGANGSISPSGAVPVSSGSTQKFNITPNVGYIIQDVLVDGASVGAVASYTFNTVTANHTISASFAVNTTTYTITATAGANGSITPSGAVVVTSGTNQTFNITANSGYAVQDVLIDGASVGTVNTYTFNNVITTHTISVSFKALITSGVLFEENFVYQGADGDSLNNPSIGSNVWKAHSGGGAARNIQFQTSSLSFNSYAGSGLGGSVTFQNNLRSQDLNAKLPNNISSSSIYSSFLLRIDSSGGKDTATDYFYHFCDTSGITGVQNFRGRVFIADGSSANTFKIGLCKGTGAKLTTPQINAGAKAPLFTTTEFNIGQTYLVVMKYVFNTATTRDDSMHLFILDASIPTSEPLPAISFADTAVSDLKQIQSVVMRQGTTGRTAGAIDGIKVFTNWADLLPATSTYSISGSINLPNNKKVNKSVITLKGSTTTVGQSDASGVYNFGNLATSNYILKPAKNNDITKANGVTSIDVLLTQRHILNTTKLNSPYKLIAADVTGDKNINSVDILRMKRLILGTDTTFNSTTKGSRLWEFIDSTYQFPDTTNPFPFKDSITISNLTSNKNNQTFIGVKLGDVNYDWNPAVARQIPVNSLQLLVTTEKKASTINYQFSTVNFKELAAFQFTLHFDNNKYEFVGIENNKLGIDFSDIQATATGNIAMLWTDKNANSKTLENGSELFTLVLKAKGLTTDNDLALTNDIAEVEAWDNDYNKHNIILSKKGITNNQSIKPYELVVYPNPAKDYIIIDCANAKQITIIDAIGRIVKQLNNATPINTVYTKELGKGVFIIKSIMNDGTIMNKKLVVE